MVPVSSRNLQVRLLILVFLAFIPALGIFWYANRELRSFQLDAKEQELVRRAQEVTNTYRHLIYQGETLLATLAEFPQIESVGFQVAPNSSPEYFSIPRTSRPSLSSAWTGTWPAVA